MSKHLNIQLQGTVSFSLWEKGWASTNTTSIVMKHTCTTFLETFSLIYRHSPWYFQKALPEQTKYLTGIKMIPPWHGNTPFIKREPNRLLEDYLLHNVPIIWGFVAFVVVSLTTLVKSNRVVDVLKFKQVQDFLGISTVCSSFGHVGCGLAPGIVLTF